MHNDMRVCVLILALAVAAAGNSRGRPGVSPQSPHEGADSANSEG